MKSAVVLLSAGLDSTVNLFAAHRDFHIATALTFDYGQRAVAREVESARALCAHLRVNHQVIELPWLQAITHTSLVNREADVPTGHDVSIDDMQVSQDTAARVWVPNRNGVFLNIAASFAESLKAEYVIPGFNKEEAATFSDNSEEYLAVLNDSFRLSTATQVKTMCFTSNMTKPEIVRMGREFGVPFDLIWPCYFSYDKICGECESCKRYLRAVAT